ncbi:hypothetical protein EV144_1011075 [Flavobacterium sp. 270]|nr:hypothetical protein EV144_1011075 [Flavobacterium sp. 270]
MSIKLKLYIKYTKIIQITVYFYNKKIDINNLQLSN